MSHESNNAIWLTVPEALTYLKVSKTTLYTVMKDGRLPFYYIKGTRQRRIKQQDLDALFILLKDAGCILPYPRPPKKGDHMIISLRGIQALQQLCIEHRLPGWNFRTTA